MESKAEIDRHTTLGFRESTDIDYSCNYTH